MSKFWIDKPVLTLKDLKYLTGYSQPRIEQYIKRGLWVPRHSRSSAPSVPRYTGRDLMRILLIGPMVGFGVHLLDGPKRGKDMRTIQLMLQDLDSVINNQFRREVEAPLLKPGRERLVFQRFFSPWAYVMVDYPMLVQIQIPRLAEYLRLKKGGMRHADAACESLRVAVAARGIMNQ